MTKEVKLYGMSNEEHCTNRFYGCGQGKRCKRSCKTL